MRRFTLQSITWAIIAGSVLSTLWLAAVDTGAPSEPGPLGWQARNIPGSRSEPPPAASAQRQSRPAAQPAR